MMGEASYASDEELFRRLQHNLREGVSDATRPARRTRLTLEANDLVRVLAERIYDAPDRWGLGQVPETWRDEVAHDLLFTVLHQASGSGIRSGVAEWSAREVKRRFEEAKGKFGGPAAEVAGQPAAQTRMAEEQPPVLLDEVDGPWQHFERQFPKEALVLRLRYLLKRTPDEVMAILGIPSTGAVSTQVRRARDRMRTSLQEAGYDRTAIARTLGQFGGDQR